MLCVWLIVDKYFMAVTCFLLFNVCAMCGSLIAAVIELVIPFLDFLLEIAVLTAVYAFEFCLCIRM